MTIHQISVFLENRAGQLADITAILSESRVDLRAINIAETADYGVLRLIVDDAQRASAVLLERGFILTMTPVVAVAVPDRVHVLRVWPEKRSGLYDLPGGRSGPPGRCAEGQRPERRARRGAGRTLTGLGLFF